MPESANILHRNAASIEIPGAILVEAVERSCSIPFNEFDRTSPYFFDPESHPAVRLISNWWNENALDYRRAAFFDIYVRGEIQLLEREIFNIRQLLDMNEYQCWCAYHQSPNMPITDFIPASTARWGDSILITFFQTRSAAKIQGQKDPVIMLGVNGTPKSDWGASCLEEFYPARDSIVALKDFPERFPGVWKNLKDSHYRHSATPPLRHRSSFAVRKSHKSPFNKALQEHIEASSCSIPATIFIEAVQKAISIPFDKNSPYCDNLESHPAMKLLSDWWNASAPKNQCAAIAMPWVRDKDFDEDEDEDEDEDSDAQRSIDPRYWCGYYENPYFRASYFCADSTARCGDAILISFAKSRTSAYYDEQKFAVLEEVGGQIFDKVGIDLKDFDPAWYSLIALRHFPVRFPLTWDALCNGIG